MQHDLFVGTMGRVVAAVVLVAVGALLATLVVRTSDGPSGLLVAECSGDEGDAGRIQSVIDDSADGDEIVFDGPCLVDTTIVLRGERAYRGESAATVLRAAPGSNLRAVLASDSWVDDSEFTGRPISLRDLTVDAARQQNPSSGDGVVIRSWHSQIENVKVYDARRNCLRVTSRSQDGTDVTTTQVGGTLRGLFLQRCGRDGLYVEDKVNAVTDWNLLDSVVGETGEDGIALENGGGWNLRGNHVFDAGGSGIDVFRLFATGITDNYVEDFGTGSGVRAYLQGAAASVIQGNKIFQAGSRRGGILLDMIGSREGTSVATVVANVLIGNDTGTGISYRTEGAALAVTSQANSVSRVGTPLTGATPNAGY